MKNGRPNLAGGALGACGKEAPQVVVCLEFAWKRDAQQAVLAAEDIFRVRNTNEVQR